MSSRLELYRISSARTCLEEAKSAAWLSSAALVDGEVEEEAEYQLEQTK